MIKVATVLSNEKQYNALIGKVKNLDNVEIYCNNASFYQFLDDKGIRFNKLDDLMLLDYWEDIDVWGCEKAILWNNVLESKEYIVSGIDYSQCLYAWFSHFLVAFARNYLFIKHIFSSTKWDKLIVFNENNKPIFPFFNEENIFKVLITKLSVEYGTDIDSIGIVGTNNERVRGNHLIEGMRRAIGNFLAKPKNISKEDKWIMVYGRLDYLENTVKKLNKEGRNVFIYDDEFRLNHFSFCCKEKISYCISNHFTRDKTYKWHDRDVCQKRLENAFEKLRLKKWFTYAGKDLSPIICDYVIRDLNFHFDYLEQSAGMYQSILSTYNVEGLLLNEDYSPQNAFLAAFFKSQKIKPFCVSHGYPFHTFFLEDNCRRVALSELFVQSECEKELYEKWGRKGTQLHVTGVPRYDNLVDRFNGNVANKRKRKILFCCALFSETNLDVPSYMGMRLYVGGKNQKIYLMDLMQMDAARDSEIIVKPHYVRDMQLWKNFIKANKKESNVKLSSATESFIKLLNLADVLIVGYWSTAIIESGLLNKPVILMDYHGTTKIPRPVQESVFRIVKNKEELEDALSSLESFDKTKTSDTSEFILGKNDNRNNERVVNSISAMLNV